MPASAVGDTELAGVMGHAASCYSVSTSRASRADKIRFVFVLQFVHGNYTVMSADGATRMLMLICATRMLICATRMLICAYDTDADMCDTDADD